MNRPLRVLIVEDSENDAALLELELERAAIPRGVNASRPPRPCLPACGASDSTWSSRIMSCRILMGWRPRAGERQDLDLPFIVVSGHITDDTAVAAMKAGAHDYVMKDISRGSAGGRTRAAGG